MIDIRMDLVFNEELSLQEGCVKTWDNPYGDYLKDSFLAAANYYEIPIDKNLPLKNYQKGQQDLLFYGVESEQFTSHFPSTKPPRTVVKGKFEGVLTGMRRRYQDKNENTREAVYFFSQPCPDCLGKRLKRESREVLVAGTSITELSNYSFEDRLISVVKECSGVT